jgi:hypothetical protein
MACPKIGLNPLQGVQTRSGDYVESQLEERMNHDKLVGDVVTHWLKYGERRRTVALSVIPSTSRPRPANLPSGTSIRPPRSHGKTGSASVEEPSAATVSSTNSIPSIGRSLTTG